MVSDKDEVWRIVPDPGVKTASQRTITAALGGWCDIKPSGTACIVRIPAGITAEARQKILRAIRGHGWEVQGESQNQETRSVRLGPRKRQ